MYPGREAGDRDLGAVCDLDPHVGRARGPAPRSSPGRRLLAETISASRRDAGAPRPRARAAAVDLAAVVQARDRLLAGEAALRERHRPLVEARLCGQDASSISRPQARRPARMRSRSSSSSRPAPGVRVEHLDRRHAVVAVRDPVARRRRRSPRCAPRARSRTSRRTACASAARAPARRARAPSGAGSRPRRAARRRAARSHAPSASAAAPRTITRRARRSRAGAAADRRRPALARARRRAERRYAFVTTDTL